MDRAIIYPGSIPMDTDLLRIGRYNKEATGYLADMVFGPGVTSAIGFDCRPSYTDLSVTIDKGSITAPGVMDSSLLGGFGGGLPEDYSSITVQYINSDKVTLPVTGTGTIFTIYAICVEQDVDENILAFFNADNPSQTQSGPNNNAGTLPTRRTATMSFTIGTSPPAQPDGGVVVALYTLNVPSGASVLAGIHPQPTNVFRATIPQLAPRSLLKDIVVPLRFVGVNTTLTVPEWAQRVELRVIGGGGGGGASNSTSLNGSFSGSGGGSGGDASGIYSVSSLDNAPLIILVGQGGRGGQTGGTSMVTYQGITLLQANGGQEGIFYSATNSVGGNGGNAVGGNIWNQTGSYGHDGQSGSVVFSGCGGAGPWGGGGRNGNQGGCAATHYGAGGGGAYSTSTDGATSLGGAGYQGCVLYRFLP